MRIFGGISMVLLIIFLAILEEESGNYFDIKTREANVLLQTVITQNDADLLNLN